MEKKKPFKDWTDFDGIYADLSKYPDEVSYYVKCPVCGQVHGSYKSMKDAHSKKVCGVCNLDQIEKIKKQIHQVVYEPEKKVKPLAAIMQEADEVPPVPVPPVPEPDDVDPTDRLDPWAEMTRMMNPDWVTTALRRIAKHLDVDEDDIEIQSRGGDYNEDNPDATTYFTVDVGSQEWMVFKDADIAHNLAEERVAEDVVNEPGLFSSSFLVGYIDTDELRDAIGDPYEDYGEDERNLDYDEKLDKMVEEDKIEFDDPLFFKKNGEPRVANKARIAQLDAMVEEWIEETKPTIDPWEWLEDNYGKDQAGEEALKLVDVDAKRIAKDVVGNDGWENTLATYDHNSDEIGPENFVICRVN